MPTNFFHRLPFKLALSSLSLAILLGFIIAGGQLYLDFKTKNHEIELNTRKIILSHSTSAQRTVHQLDKKLAADVVKGISHYKALQVIAIYNENDDILAAIHHELIPSSTQRITRLLVGDFREFKHPLIYHNGEYQGYLYIKVNNDSALQPLYERAIFIFLSELVRSVSLALILICVYHLLITRPLVTIANSLSQIQMNKTHGNRITPLKKHIEDELGYIVNTANNLIDHLESRQQDVEQREHQLRVILDATPNQVFAVNLDGQIIFVNSTTEHFYQLNAAVLIGQNHFDILSAINRDEAREFFSQFNRAQSESQQSHSCKLKLTDANASHHVMHTAFVHFKLYDTACILVILNDITSQVKAEERVEKLAYYDTLTQLPNRNQIRERLQRDIASTQKNRRFGAVLFIDIDNFKRINDTMGHSIGDELLLIVSKKMLTQIRSTETLARLGGDEFILSVPNIADNRDSARSQIIDIAYRLLNCLRKPIHLANRDFLVSASVGIALYPEKSQDIDKLLQHADTAMYQAKKNGRDCFELFAPEMEVEANHLIQLETDIRHAIEKKEFEFYLQPIILQSDHSLYGAELLMRWNHPQKGLLSPVYFMDFLVESSMMREIGAQFFDAICAFIVESKNQHFDFDNKRISINLSAKELYQPGFITNIENTLQKYQLSGDHFEFEITEGAALQHVDDAVAKMLKLQRKGIQFALDDFGTGYSSLSYLKRLPVNKMKIDKSFIKDLTRSPQDAALVASMVAIAKNLDILIVAEGIEEQDQIDWFSNYDNILFQGYYFSKPLPAKTFRQRFMLQTATI